MCLFKRKKKVVISNNKYELGQFVNFKYKNEVCPGVICNVKLDQDNNVTYDVQIGGECPVIVKDVQEDKIFLRR